MKEDPTVPTRRDRLKQLRAFCHAARLESISQAAKHLSSSQPAVSMQIHSLEQELGVTLFERQKRRIALSRIGRRLYRLAIPLVERIDRLPDTFAEEFYGVVSNDLKFGAGQLSSAFLLPSYVKQFLRHNPWTRVCLKIGSGRERLHWLRSYEVDLVVAAMDVPPPDVEFHKVATSEFVFVTPEHHPLAGRESVAVKETAPYPFVGHSRAHYIRHASETAFRLYGEFTPRVVTEVNGWRAIVNYVAAGIGISVVPDLCVSRHDRVRLVPIKDVRLPPRHYGAVTRRDGPLSLPSRRLLEVMVATAVQDSPGQQRG